jgi:hypothetical protein
MDDSQSKALPLKAAYVFGIANGLKQEVEAIQSMEIKWTRSYTSSLRRGYIVSLFEKNGLLDKFKAEYWEFGNTKEGAAKVRFYKRLREEYEDLHLGTSSLPKAVETDEAEGQIETEKGFALESHLRDFLVKNLQCIEPGLKLYTNGAQTGVEYYIDDNNGRIDILAVDSGDCLVVIELKVGKGRNRTVGQLLYYMGWVNKNLKAGCRGMIIAREIPEDLLLAIGSVQNVEGFSYSLAFDLKRRTD